RRRVRRDLRRDVYHDPRGVARVLLECPMAFEKEFTVSWAQLDANGHMANTAFLDICVDVRFAHFESQGFPASEFARLRIGPVVRRDEADYYREMHRLQPSKVNFALAGISDDASRFRIRHEVFRAD